MSKERQRARAAREQARAAEQARLAQAQKRRARVERVTPTLPKRAPRTPRQRRFGALPTRVRLSLALGWLGVQLLVWQVVADPRTRLGLGVVTLMALPIVVVLTRDPSRRRS